MSPKSENCPICVWLIICLGLPWKCPIAFDYEELCCCSKHFFLLSRLQSQVHYHDNLWIHTYNWLDSKHRGMCVSILSKMFSWEPECRYRCTKSLMIAPFWFSMERLWIVIAPFWLSTDVIRIFWAQRANLAAEWADEHKRNRKKVITFGGVGCTSLYKCIEQIE